MPCFPQLLTGASSQYPIRKRNNARTILKTMEEIAAFDKKRKG